MTEKYSRRKLLGKGLKALLIGTGAAGASGCYVFSQPIDDFISRQSDKIKISSEDDVLDKYFTEEAKNVLKDIPVFITYTNHISFFGFSPDNDLISSLGGWFTSGHYGRQVCINQEGVRDESKISIDEEVLQLYLVHEYIHQAQYAGLIDQEAFNKAYERLLCEKSYDKENCDAPYFDGLLKYIETDVLDHTSSDNWWQAFFTGSSVEETKAFERVAYFGSMSAVFGRDLNRDFNEVYKDVLKVSQEAVARNNSE
ncbi:hypothetical protein ACFL0W_04510 [Nanoarchaeota archaeon]